MGIFDIFGKDEPAAPARTEPDSKLASAATGFVQRLLDVGVDGKGTFDSARQVADTALSRHHNPDKAIDDIVNEHTKLAAAGGFVTGLGGFITLPVALPANVIGFYILATRMVAAVAKVRGYDVESPNVRSAILLGLVGADAGDVLRKAGVATSGGRRAFKTRAAGRAGPRRRGPGAGCRGGAARARARPGCGGSSRDAGLPTAALRRCPTRRAPR